MCAWVAKCGFPSEVTAAFAEARVDGDLLLQLDEKDLSQDLGLKNGIHRKRFLRELNTLKKTADYSSKDRYGVVDFLVNRVGPEYKVYAYNLIKSDLNLSFMRRVATSDGDLHDLLKEAGVASAIHRIKIADAIFASFDEDPGYDEETADNFRDVVYVSFARDLTAELASVIKMKLGWRGLDVITGDEDNGDILDKVSRAGSFVLVLSPGTLDHLRKNNGRMYREIATALASSDCNVVPVFADDFVFPDAESLPEDIRPIALFNGVKWVHDYQDACIDKLERFLLKKDSSEMSLSTCSATSTPRISRKSRINSSSPLFPMRKRTISMDSAISAVSLN